MEAGKKSVRDAADAEINQILTELSTAFAKLEANKETIKGKQSIVDGQEVELETLRPLTEKLATSENKIRDLIGKMNNVSQERDGMICNSLISSFRVCNVCVLVVAAVANHVLLEEKHTALDESHKSVRQLLVDKTVEAEDLSTSLVELKIEDANTKEHLQVGASLDILLITAALTFYV